MRVVLRAACASAVRHRLAAMAATPEARQVQGRLLEAIAPQEHPLSLRGAGTLHDVQPELLPAVGVKSCSSRLSTMPSGRARMYGLLSTMTFCAFRGNATPSGGMWRTRVMS
jgi:hypothetical protein